MVGLFTAFPFPMLLCTRFTHLSFYLSVHSVPGLGLLLQFPVSLLSVSYRYLVFGFDCYGFSLFTCRFVVSGLFLAFILSPHPHMSYAGIAGRDVLASTQF
jgi:hypothetical protein